ncbi:AbrB/MazE/SpoVT family DNA-binding domain-containing protein [Candidatus Eisenbacteria bacterium]|uniref:AbrB/MazE/SpoVT family DNA-binding domain-containing protein n=1 Tax=Eiseniibacteriota bacterium TaxID=2212470 RepID=A0ABV6YLU9_UNCEI
MTRPSTTKMSSKGQIVIPEEIRRRLGLRAGVQFVVVGDRDVIILKTVSAPDEEDFVDLLADARKQARKAGMKRSDITEAIAAARRKR